MTKLAETLSDKPWLTLALTVFLSGLAAYGTVQLERGTYIEKIQTQGAAILALQNVTKQDHDALITVRVEKDALKTSLDKIEADVKFIKEYLIRRGK